MTWLVMTLLLFVGFDSWATNSNGDLVVGKVEIVRGSIFSEAETDSTEGTLSILRKSMNSLHINTREHVLSRELLFKEGQSYNPELLEETERNLRELGFLNNIRVTAVDTTENGEVNIRVEARDSWSLKTSLNWTRSASGETRWGFSLSEVNFLGQGVTLGAGVGADENASYYNIWFRKRRLTKAGLVLGLDYAKREDGHYRNIFVSRPFYSLGDKWSVETRAYESLSDVRYYLSNAGPAGIDPQSGSSLYARLPRLETGIHLGTLLRLSKAEEGRIWRLGAGLGISDLQHDLDVQPSWLLSDGRYVDLSFLNEGEQPMARHQGVTVFPYIWINSKGRSWNKARFILQYGPIEDIPMNWSFDLKAGPNGPAVGSTSGFGGSTWKSEFVATKWWQLGPGMFKLQSWGKIQTGSSENSFHQVNVQSGWLATHGAEHSPWITRLTAEAGHGNNLIGDNALLLGLNNSLRTLDFDGMAGDRLLRWNVEQGKAMPWEVLGLFQMGLAAFYSGGVAYWDDEDRSLADSRHEVGFGIRLGPTRAANALISKLDLTWDLDGFKGPVFTAASRGFF
ncbi:MAG: hypothetical protein GY780_07080 [bacterium]|nr:hypothetical protein [bacterium]